MAFHQSTSIYFGLLLMIFLVPKFGCQHESLPIKINNSNQIIYEHQLKPNKSINNVYDVDNNDDNDWQIGFYIMISLIPIWCLLFGFVIFTIYVCILSNQYPENNGTTSTPLDDYVDEFLFADEYDELFVKSPSLLISHIA